VLQVHECRGLQELSIRSQIGVETNLVIRHVKLVEPDHGHAKHVADEVLREIPEDNRDVARANIGNVGVHGEFETVDRIGFAFGQRNVPQWASVLVQLCTQFVERGLIEQEMTAWALRKLVLTV
jgi:hypothetical protein